MAMVNTKHRVYKKLFPRWKMIRDAVEGEHAIKAAEERYLPKLQGATDSMYKAYVQRAVFFEATQRTLQGLVGLVMQKPPQIEAKDNVKEVFLKSLTKSGMSVAGFSAVILREVLMMNKYGILADLPSRISEESEPWLVGYTAESIINWDFKTSSDGKLIPTRIVLEESYEKIDPEDRFKSEDKKQYRVLELVDPDIEFAEHMRKDVVSDNFTPRKVPGESSVYRVQVYRAKKDLNEKAVASKDEFILYDEFFPNFQGNAIARIPFVIVTAEDEDKEDQKPPLEGLASINISHYRTSADLEHGRHFTALPTPYVVGLSEQQNLYIGSTKAWVISGVNATDVKIGMLEFTGQGLQALENAIEEKESQMARIGARLLEEQKKSAEAFETLKLRTSGEQSILAAIANGVSEGLNESLLWMNEWDPSLGEISVKLNTDFVRMVMDPQMLTSLVSSLQGGKISFKTFFFNMKERGMYPDEHTEEDELELISVDSGNPDSMELEDEEEEEGETTGEKTGPGGDNGHTHDLLDNGKTSVVNGHSHTYEVGASTTSTVNGHMHSI